MNGKLSGRRALITGGSSGIGKATAYLFAQEGASVAIVGRSEEKGCVLVKELNEGGHPAVFIRADVSQAEDCRAAVEGTVHALGGVDILFNNAGIVQRGGVSEVTEEEWDRTMAVNVRSIFLMSKYAVPHLAESPFGAVIVNMGSVLSHAGARSVIAYAASKAAVLSMTKSMALDLCRQHIRVVCICPGDTETPSLMDEAKQLGIPYKEFVASSIARRPLGIIGAPQDIARGVLYLASDDARYITGTSLVIDGGGLTAYGMG
jgi:NAD(P)-dependent dehydrogenase (short-subunit alcohol dehydrogenase family)